MMEQPAWKRALYQIWPKINRFFTGIIFFIFKIVRAGVKEGVRQIQKI
jgi:hypothetical protein